jgi:predicted DNA-binding transcriptional regulator YafY
VHFGYFSPYRGRVEEWRALPAGLFWDRDRWYLVGYPLRPDALAPGTRPRLWRADRVLSLASLGAAEGVRPAFAIGQMLGRDWLRAAMAEWRASAPVIVRLTPEQAARLAGDWYYRHAAFVAEEDGRVLMTIGEADRRIVLELVRWLGPGTELLEPVAWRAVLREELSAMLADHADERDLSGT